LAPRRRRPPALALGLLLTALALAPVAGADTLNVRPGSGNPLQRAIDRARDGDRIKVHEGTYGAVKVDKRVRIFGAAGERRPTIDGDCGVRGVVNVRSNGVSLDHLAVIGADESFGPYPSQVEFIGIRTGRVTDSRISDSCDGAEYGVNVFNGGRIVVAGNKTEGFSDAGVYIGGITDTSAGTLVVRNNLAVHNNRGIIIEDSSGVDIDVLDNVVKGNRSPGEGNRDGIFIHNSDGIRIKGNSAIHNGQYGIELDAGSDDNRLFGNVAERNSVADFLDLGSGNCGDGNSFTIPHC
jgi:parallel beta-helix repeat protein